MAQTFSMPPEWAPHAATWLIWPHNRDDWPGKTRAAEWAFCEMARHIAMGETVRILVPDAKRRARARDMLDDAGCPLETVEFLLYRSDRSWVRDCGPLFVKSAKGTVKALDFRFTGWAKYRAHTRDDAVPRVVAEKVGFERTVVRENGRHIVLEGGAIDIDGSGTLLTTERCLLDQAAQVRNPGMRRGELESVFKRYLGISRTLWLGDGIIGDDTHGHVDDVARFIAPGIIALAREDDPQDDNYAALAENRERLQRARLADGARPQVVNLPMPRPVFFRGRRLPASYANFFFCNAALLVPAFNDVADREALGILAEVVDDRPVIGIHALDLVWGRGTLHCLTQQQPLGGR